MNILLVKPYNLSDHIQVPLGLGYLATAIRNKHNVKIVDCLKENISSPQILLEIISGFDTDLLGIQCYTFHLKFIRKVFSAVKKSKKEIVCIVGGPHPSTLPLETMRDLSGVLDYGFVGEAEIGFKRLVDALSDRNGVPFEDIPGLIFNKDGKVYVNPPMLVKNLDTLGYPAWDLLRPQEYPEAQHGAFYRNFPIAPIMVTRGCPYPCTFCAGNKVSGKEIRKHSIGYVLNQITMLRRDFNILEFHIVDDNFTFDIEYAKKLLRGIIGLGLGMSWATPNGVRLDRLDNELLTLMKKSGLYLISLGIESGSDRVLKLMKKGTTVSQIREKVKIIRGAGLEIAGFFIIGYPGETEEEIKTTIRFACELDLIRANFFTYLPFPGTESFKELEEKGELKNVDWDNFYFISAAYVSNGLTRKEMKNYQREAFFKFYLRPKTFIRNLLEIKSVRHFMFLFKRFYHWIIK